MKRRSYEKLCDKIVCAVGPSNFKSEMYLDNLYHQDSGLQTRAGCMYRNSKGHTGDYVSGKWKVGLALRYLSGATCLDLSVVWDLTKPYQENCGFRDRLLVH